MTQRNILVLADEYAAAVAVYAKGIAMGDDSMSPLARDAGDAGDKRKVLADAIEAAQPQAAVDPVGYFSLDPISFPGCIKLYTAPPDNTAEMEALRRANLDCVDHFNALKADYDEAQEAMRLALDAFQKILGNVYDSECQTYQLCQPAIAALEESLNAG